MIKDCFNDPAIDVLAAVRERAVPLCDVCKRRGSRFIVTIDFVAADGEPVHGHPSPAIVLCRPCDKRLEGFDDMPRESWPNALQQTIGAFCEANGFALPATAGEIELKLIYFQPSRGTLN